MRKLVLPISAIILAITIGCNGRKFPEPKKLSEYKHTTFLPTLEHQLPANNNSVYCASLLYAWNEVKVALNHPLLVNKSSKDLYLFNRSKSHVATLMEHEYSSTAKVEGDLITVRAEFSKSLPFELELSSYDHGILTFDSKKVSAFGTMGFDDEVSKVLQIMYYKDDGNFIIRLQPANKEHEIVLYKTTARFKTMAEIVADIEKKTTKGNQERKNPELGWRYAMRDGDEVVIPKLEFNIETSYSTLEGQKFQSFGRTYHIGTAWQRTAFILDEKGAEIESEAEESYLMDEESEPEVQRPKSMRFDKPFFTMLRRADSTNPYLAIWTSNTELMKRVE